jgi:hypothetical protein
VESASYVDDALLVQGTGHGAVLSAIRVVLADGHAHSAGEICRTGIARGILVPTTIPSDIQHAISTLLDRQRDRGEKPEILILPDGRYRRNVAIDPFEGHVDPKRRHPELEELVARLRADVMRAHALPDDTDTQAGKAFEEAVTTALRFLGYEAQRLGGQGEPDVVATAPLGDRTYRVAFECKTFDAQKLHDSAAFVVEAARLRDVASADYAVLIGAAFPEIRAVDDEMQQHRVAMWTLDDLISLLTAHADHPIAWSRLRTLYAPGRSHDAIAAFVHQERHGVRQRAHITLRLVLEAGLEYQLSLAHQDPQVERVPAPLTAEALVVLVNQRLAAEGDLGRIGVADVQRAIDFASDPLVGAVSVVGTAVYIERRVGPESP